MREMKSQLDSGCVDFGDGTGPAAGEAREQFLEELALCDEEVMEHYLEHGTVEQEEICRMTAERKVFPCFFGSALKIEGVTELLNGLAVYSREPDYPEAFGAKVFKISRDSQGNRLTHVKITGGRLRVKELLAGTGRDETPWKKRLTRSACIPGKSTRCSRRQGRAASAP